VTEARERSEAPPLYLADYSGDCRTLSVERMLEQALEMVREDADGPMPVVGAAVILRWSNGDVCEIQCLAAGVDTMGLLGLLRLGSLAIERPQLSDD